jgi:hypothetical protein
MNQAEALKRLEELESRRRQRDLRPMLESLAAQTGVSVDAILAEAERLITTYGSNSVAMECGIAQEMGITVEEIRDESTQVVGGA